MKPLLILALLLASPLAAQTPQTSLAIVTHWDSGAAVAGTVTLTKLVDPPVLLAARNLNSNGRASVWVPLVSLQSYSATLSFTNPTDGSQQTLTVPFIAVVDSTVLKSATVTLVLALADNSVVSRKATLVVAF